MRKIQIDVALGVLIMRDNGLLEMLLIAAAIYLIIEAVL